MGKISFFITISFFISIDTNTFQIFMSFKFKGRILLPSESWRNQTVYCGFKLEHDKHLFLNCLHFPSHFSSTN